MVTITVTTDCLWRVEYHLQGIRVAVVESADRAVIDKQVSRYLAMDMGHAKGKKFTTHTGREL